VLIKDIKNGIRNLLDAVVKLPVGRPEDLLLLLKHLQCGSRHNGSLLGETLNRRRKEEKKIRAGWAFVWAA
jgi:hypothetical protein